MRYFCRNEKQEGIKENEDRLFLFPKLYIPILKVPNYFPRFLSTSVW